MVFNLTKLEIETIQQYPEQNSSEVSHTKQNIHDGGMQTLRTFLFPSSEHNVKDLHKTFNLKQETFSFYMIHSSVQIEHMFSPSDRGILTTIFFSIFAKAENSNLIVITGESFSIP